MALPAKERATYADLLAAPAHLIAEIVGGELVTSPRPGPLHSAAASALGGELWSPFRRGRGGPGGWLILDEPELHLLGGEEVLVPDLAGWRVERMPELPQTAWFEVTPDWVCEVASPSTAAFDRADKMPVYARASVRFAWILDPNVQTLETYALESDHWVLLETFRGDRGVRAMPFDAIELELGMGVTLLWAPNRKPAVLESTLDLGFDIQPSSSWAIGPYIAAKFFLTDPYQVDPADHAALLGVGSVGLRILGRY